MSDELTDEQYDKQMHDVLCGDFHDFFFQMYLYQKYGPDSEDGKKIKAALDVAMKDASIGGMEIVFYDEDNHRNSLIINEGE